MAGLDHALSLVATAIISRINARTILIFDKEENKYITSVEVSMRGLFVGGDSCVYERNLSGDPPGADILVKSDRYLTKLAINTNFIEVCRLLLCTN